MTADGYDTQDPGLLPTQRYLGLIQTGAAEMALDQGYRAWLDQVPCVPDKSRGPEYYRLSRRNFGK